MRAALFLIVAASAVALAGCAGTTNGSPPATSTAAPAGGGIAVATASSTLGTILVDAQGRTLYLFEADKGNSSACSSTCTAAWPPVVTTGTPQAGAGLPTGHLGTIARNDGSKQVTYYGHPLYYFVQDAKSGDTGGQGKNAFGAGWYVVAPNGNKIDNS